jgi:hypothetical protein
VSESQHFLLFNLKTPICPRIRRMGVRLALLETHLRILRPCAEGASSGKEVAIREQQKRPGWCDSD